MGNPQIILPETITVNDLRERVFPDQKWLVPQIIPDSGLTLLASPPKLGKSWMCIDVCTSLASRRAFLINGSTGPQIKTLYIALEDTLRRLKNRIIKIGAEGDGCLIATTWQQGIRGADALKTFLSQNTEIKLVIIDTLGKFFPARDGNDYFEMTMIMSTLKNISDESGTTIVVVHHTRKQESDDFANQIMGSAGIAGVVDTIIVLHRKRGQLDAVMHITGRDVEENELALTFDKTSCRWSILGLASNVAETSDRQAIMDLLKGLSDPQSARAVSDILGKPYDTVRRLMARMVIDEQLDRTGRGLYTVRTYNETIPF